MKLFNKMKLLKSAIIAAVIMTMLMFITGCTTTENIVKDENKVLDETYSTFAQCLTEKGATFYGTEWCTHCKSQKALFGDSMKDVNFIDCDDQKEVCRAAGITGYPTWIIGGQKYVGTQSLEKLASVTACELPKVEA